MLKFRLHDQASDITGAVFDISTDRADDDAVFGNFQNSPGFDILYHVSNGLNHSRNSEIVVKNSFAMEGQFLQFQDFLSIMYRG